MIDLTSLALVDGESIHDLDSCWLSSMGLTALAFRPTCLATAAEHPTGTIPSPIRRNNHVVRPPVVADNGPSAFQQGGAEINYPPIMRTIVETGYTGYVAQEFIPTWPDKLGALRHGVRVCDV
jgi:hypothetical protein